MQEAAYGYVGGKGPNADERKDCEPCRQLEPQSECASKVLITIEISCSFLYLLFSESHRIRLTFVLALL
jgi:hypothetical protein